MTDDESETFLMMVMDELLLKQAELNRIYAFGEWARWGFEKSTEGSSIRRTKVSDAYLNPKFEADLSPHNTPSR